jgi:hypothetical protein
MAFLLRPAERESFKRCRRAWDLGARTRQDWVPAAPAPTVDPAAGLHAALAVYYFPGMWAWDRAIVEPLVQEAFAKATRGQGGDPDVLASGRALLENYFLWAPARDQFTPLRVVTDFEVNIPDPDRPGADLITPGGDPIRYAGRIDLLVQDNARRYWMVQHRVVAGPWVDPEILSLSDLATSWCWAWEHFSLGTRMAGVMFNELRWDAEDGEVESFRRTPIGKTPAELAVIGERLASEAKEMVDPYLRLYPSPSIDHCPSCAYRAPCRALDRAEDPEPILRVDYRHPPDAEPEEGRLGGVSWGMGRGAAPPKFGRGGR